MTSTCKLYSSLLLYWSYSKGSLNHIHDIKWVNMLLRHWPNYAPNAREIGSIQYDLIGNTCGTGTKVYDLVLNAWEIGPICYGPVRKACEIRTIPCDPTLNACEIGSCQIGTKWYGLELNACEIRSICHAPVRPCDIGSISYDPVWNTRHQGQFSIILYYTHVRQCQYSNMALWEIYTR